MNLSALVLPAYILASLIFIADILTRRLRLTLAARLAYLAAVGLHLTFVIRLGIQIGHIPLTTPTQAVNMIIFLAGLVMAPFICRGSTVALGAFFTPFATFAYAATAPLAGITAPLAPEKLQLWYPLHTMTVIGGETLFLISAILAVVYLIHERSIRRGDIHASGTILPPLATLDRLLYLALISGFILLTIGMITGSMWAGNATVPPAQIIPKAASGLLVWSAFAFVLHQRFAIGWQGKRTAIITLIGFLIMVTLTLAIWGLYPGVHGLELLR